MKQFKFYLTFLLIFLSLTPQARAENTPEPCTIVIFGATGDLTAKKLIPALYALKKGNTLPKNTTIVGFARRDYSNDDFRNHCQKLSTETEASDPYWDTFAENLLFLSSNFNDEEGYQKLNTLLKEIDRANGTQGNRLYFLATQPSTFSTIINQLNAQDLLNDTPQGWSRVMLEKPFGSDLASAIALQETLDASLKSEQVFRIDHYLAKEGLQNLLVQRFQNTWLEPMWNANWIDHIQITMSEDIGIGTRANLWEETGALRDSFQNHLMQMLALVAMEPPARLDAASIARKKIDVLNHLRPMTVEQVDDFFIRGQYTAGSIKGNAVLGYHEEAGVAKTSLSETYVGAKLYIDTPRWQDVPFYLIGGKRLPRQTTEIAVVFKPAKLSSSGEGNTLFIRIQPNAGIYLAAASKVPGLDNADAQLRFGFSPEAAFSAKAPDAYQKLFFDAIRGDATHFVEGEEQIAAWRFLEPVLQRWGQAPTSVPYPYPAGSWGPIEANRLFLGTGHQWIFLDN